MAQSTDQIFALEKQMQNIVPAKTGYVAVRSQGRPVYFREDQAFVRPRAPKRVEFTPTVQTNVVFGGSEQITEFRIYEQTDLEQINHLTLRGTLSKPAGAVTTSYLVTPAPLWITRIEILLNGSTTVAQTIYADQIWSAFAHIDKEHLSTLISQNMMYMGTNFKVNNFILPGSAIGQTWAGAAAGTARPFHIPLLGTLLEKFRIRALGGDTILRVYWNPLIACDVTTPWAIGANTGANEYRATPTNLGSSHFQVSNLQLVLESEEVLSKDKALFDKLVRENTLLVKYLDPIVQTFSQPLSAGTQLTLQLTAIYGPIAFMQIYIRDTTLPLAQTKALGPAVSTDPEGGDFSVTGDISITDSSNKQLFTPNGFKIWDLRYGQYAKHFSNEYTNSVPHYTLSFCETPQAALMKGVVDGYVDFKANEYLVLRPSAEFTTINPARITVVAWKLKHLQISKKMGTVI
jgi:hypothetical protein